MTTTQLTLDFRGASRRPVLVRYTPSDREFFATTPLDRLPASFLMESRAQRLGCNVDELRCMRSYDLARELADETAVLGMGPLDETCRIPPTRIDRATLDAAAKLHAAERAADFREYLAAKQNPMAANGLSPSRRRGTRS